MQDGWPSTITSLFQFHSAQNQQVHTFMIHARITCLDVLDLPVHTDRVRVATGKQRGSSGTAELYHVILFQTDASQCKLVDCWRVDRGPDLLSVVAHVRISQVVDQYEQDCASQIARDSS